MRELGILQVKGVLGHLVYSAMKCNRKRSQKLQRSIGSVSISESP